MKRRQLLAGCGCGLSLALAGCVDDAADGTGDDEPTSNGDESDEDTGDDADDLEPDTYYELQIDAPTTSPGELDRCRFEALPEAAQTEFENALDAADFDTEERVLYRLEDSPAILETDCHGGYIEYQGAYYETNVIAAGG